MEGINNYNILWVDMFWVVFWEWPTVFCSIILCGIWFHSPGPAYLIELFNTCEIMHHGIWDFAWVSDLKLILMVLMCTKSINNNWCKLVTYLSIVIIILNWICSYIFFHKMNDFGLCIHGHKHVDIYFFIKMFKIHVRFFKFILEYGCH